jgi:uncharacterized protein
MVIKTIEELSEGARALLRQVKFPDSFPQTCKPYFLVETHLSVVVVGSEYTIKWKKPEQFSFIDLRMVNVRRHAVQEEIALNRRHSTGVYLGIAEARDDCHELVLHHNVPKSPEDDSIEWGVWMKTLPDNQFLAGRIKAHNISEQDIILVAQRLADFHRQQLTHPVLKSSDAYYKTVSDHCADNIKALSQACSYLSVNSDQIRATIIQSNHEMVSRYLPLLADRCEQGWLIDGHGDLRADHISFATAPISLIDCIEFSAEYREIDVLDELAFLAMDLRRHFRSDLSKILVDTYRSLVPNAFNIELFTFYLYYRATVRAKVEFFAWLQLSDSGIKSPAQWQGALRLALSCAHGFTGPRVIALAGLMGTGKSTLAQTLLSQVYAAYLQADQIRLEIFSKGDRVSAYGSGLYSDENRCLVYQTINERALALASAGEIVIIDASFACAKHRRELAERCAEFKIPFYLIHCTLDREQTIARLEARSMQQDTLSDGRRELYDSQASSFQGILASERAYTYEVDMNLPLLKNMALICSSIFNK